MEKLIHEYCEMFKDELENTKQEIKQAGGFSDKTLDRVDKIFHSMKDAKAVLAMEQSGSYKRGYNEGNYNRGSYGYDGNPNTDYTDPNSRPYNSYRRGGYSADESFAQEIHKLINKAPTQQMRMEMERLAQQANNAM